MSDTRTFDIFSYTPADVMVELWGVDYDTALNTPVYEDSEDINMLRLLLSHHATFRADNPNGSDTLEFKLRPRDAEVDVYTVQRDAAWENPLTDTTENADYDTADIF